MKYIHIYLLLFSLAMLSSCKKFLDTKPQDFVSPEFYYNTEAQLNTALNGVYDILGKTAIYGDAMWEKFNVVNDEAYFNNSNPTAIATGVRVQNFDASDVDVKALWAALYEGINRANLLLTNIDKPDMDATNRQIIEGETKFLRAYFYFLLVSNWGDVPLVLTPTTTLSGTDIESTGTAKVYDFILSEMTDAEAKVKTITSLGFGGRISKTAVEGILARVCLYMAGYPLQDASKYQDALTWANKAMQSNEHALNPSYRQVFINYAQDLYDIKESMWEVEFWGNQIGNNYQESGGLGYINGIVTSNQSIGYSYGFINATPILYNLYETKDSLRRDWNIAPFSYSSTGGKTLKASNDLYTRNCGKWRREYETVTPKAINHTSQNFAILRYSDVLLMYAEAENEINGPTTAAYDAINAVRARGYGKLLPGALDPHEADLPTGLSKEEFLKRIQDERSRELCFECLRRPDLIRWGIYVPVMKQTANYIATNASAAFKYAANPGNNTTDRNVLLPKPQTDLAVNKLLKQNLGW
jgi:starch-binding outer membrane protein, SusD/RagB family